jgi:hypothetical protein
LQIVRSIFSAIPDKRKKNVNISLPDALMSALAMFSMKYSSLLKFDEERNKEVIKHNLQTLYGVKKVPCDTQMREIIDPVNPFELRPLFVAIFNEIQRAGILEQYKYIDDYYIVSIDATGQYCSSEISCPECCVKNHRNREVSYYHQSLAAALVHPDKKTVFSFAPEAIIKEKDASKNDCELNATKRLLAHIKEEHPKLKLLIVQDALHANAPNVNLLKLLGYSFITGIKEDDHKYLFNKVQETICAGNDNEFEYYDEELKRIRGFRFINNLSLNKSNPDLLVNFLEYWETSKDNDKNILYFTWITDISLTKECVFKVMRAGRARWKIENEVFNTLKNQDYHFEHNYGHGKSHLSTVFSMLMMLAFLIDQTQECCCPLFQAAKGTFRTKIYLWSKMQALFLSYFILDWESFYLAIIYKHKPHTLDPDIDLGIEIYLNSS